MGVDTKDVSGGAGLLKTILGPAGAMLGSQELSQAASALGGVAGVLKLANYFQSGMPGGATGAIGAGGTAAGVVAALLGQIASATGSKELGQAAQAVGAAASAAGLAGTAATLATTGGTLGITAATPALSAVTSAVGAGLAPAAAFMLGTGIANMVNPGSTADVSDMFTRGDIDPYLTFGKELGKSLGQEDKALGTLEKALPYVQSKEELGRLLNTYKSSLGYHNDWEVGNQFGSKNPYEIGYLPGATGTSHEWKQYRDFSPQVSRDQGLVNTLRSTLPGQDYLGSEGVGSNDWLRLWGQFGDQAASAPYYLPQDQPGTSYQSGEGYVTTPGASKGFYTADQLATYGALPQAIAYGQPGYDYAGAGVLAPGQTVGQPSSYWQSLISGNPVPGTSDYIPPLSAQGTIGQTGGMRTGMGAMSPLSGGQPAKVSPNITTGVQQQPSATGFVSGKTGAV